MDGKIETNPNPTIIRFDIPVININDSEIIKVNQEISNMFQNLEKEIKSWPNKINDTVYYCYNNNQNKYCGQELAEIDSKIHNDDKYLIIQIITTSGTYHGSGTINKTYYTVSKDTYKLLSKEELLKKFNTTEEQMIKLVKDYFSKKLDADVYKDQEQYLDDSMQYTVYKDKLLITFDWFTGSGSSELLSDGKQIIEINYDEFDENYFK
jgi:hypothetical protein